MNQYSRLNQLLRPSALALLTSNAITILVALIQQWDFSMVIWAYWFQSVIIGLFQWKKILDLKTFSTKGFTINHRAVKATAYTKHYTAWFFLFHYGFFHFVYALFLFTGVGRPHLRALLPIIAVFLLNHLFSYMKNRRQDSTQKQNIGKMMSRPYARIVPMHLIIMLGAVFTKGPVALVVFLLLKTASDVAMHLSEHKKA